MIDPVQVVPGRVKGSLIRVIHSVNAYAVLTRLFEPEEPTPPTGAAGKKAE